MYNYYEIPIMKFVVIVLNGCIFNKLLVQLWQQNKDTLWSPGPFIGLTLSVTTINICIISFQPSSEPFGLRWAHF